MSRYLITLDLTEHFAEHCAKFLQKYNTYKTRWLPPHITLIPPTDGKLTAEQRKNLRELHFNLEIHGIGWGSFSRDGEHIMYIMPHGDGLIELWHQVSKIVGQGIHQSLQAPQFHITVAKCIPDFAWSALQSAVVKEDPRGSSKIDHLTVYTWDEQANNWKID